MVAVTTPLVSPAIVFAKEEVIEPFIVTFALGTSSSAFVISVLKFAVPESSVIVIRLGLVKLLTKAFKSFKSLASAIVSFVSNVIISELFIFAIAAKVVLTAPDIIVALKTPEVTFAKEFAFVALTFVSDIVMFLVKRFI